MPVSDALITADTMPHADDVLARDVAFHLGEREQYEVHSIAEVCATRPVPDNAFLCVCLGARKFIAGAAYQEACEIGPDGIRAKRGRLTRKQNRALKVIARDRPFMDPSLPYAFELRDGREYDYAALFGTEKPIPVFQHHRRKGLAAIVHPFSQHHQYTSSGLPPVNDTIPFAEKLPKIFWRGSLTAHLDTPFGRITAGRLLKMNNLDDGQKLPFLRQSPRFALCEAYANSDFVDAGLVIPWGEQGYPAQPAALERFCRPRSPVEEHCRYRYVLALDGYDGPSCWFWMVSTNCLIFRQESSWLMFGDCYFEPWVHFVPIAADGSDLEEKFLWCERNIAACERMVRNANCASSILFDPAQQVNRRRAVLETYNSWLRS